MKMCGGVEAYLQPFLTLELDVGGWSASRYNRFIPEVMASVPIR
jgi:hypothetical protein